MDEKLLLTDESVKKMAEIGDKIAKFKNPFLEFVDGTFFKITFGQLNRLTSKIDFDDYTHQKVNDLIDAAHNEDETTALSIVTDVENHYIDVPIIGEPEEKEIFSNINGLLFGLIKKFFKANKDSQPLPPGQGGDEEDDKI